MFFQYLTLTFNFLVSFLEHINRFPPHNSGFPCWNKELHTHKQRNLLKKGKKWESILISKSWSSSMYIRQTREMNPACFFCTQHFLLPYTLTQQWNTDYDVPKTAVMYLWHSLIYSVMTSCGINGQILTSEVLTAQGREPFHELEKS